jgi:hypothetical protein
MTVKDTLEFIKTAHAGQMYGSNPYWVHPKTVADKLTKEQALYVANIFSNYFDRFERIDDYIRDQKLNSLAERSVGLPGMGPEDDLFSDFSINPMDMKFELIELPQDTWDIYLNIISSHSNMTSIPGRCYRLAVLEKTTGKWVGFIRLGSPVINMKPRNEMLGGVFIQTPESAKSFNHTSVMGFALVPAQPFGFNYLGGKLLAGICCSHEVREALNKKYDMNTCLFETTSLYGSSKSSSQYDGMKPYLRFKGLTDSDFLPMMHGQPYKDMKTYLENVLGEFVPADASSRKLKISNKAISLTKVALKGTPEGEKFNATIKNALGLIERKRYYASNYGFSNFTDVVMGKTDKLVKDKENYDKHHLESIVEWWKKKAQTRYDTLKTEGRLRQEIEVWTGDKEFDIIR